MSAGGNHGGTVGMGGAADDGADVWIGLELAEAAAGAKVGPVPVPEIMAGGRRLRRRHRTMVGALALASAVVLAGGAMTGLRSAPGEGNSAQVVAPAAAPSTTATATPSAPTAKDPLTPTRVVLAQGTVGGKEWKVWAALWPLAPKEQAFRQAQAVAQERRAVDPEVPEPTEAFVRQYWQPHDDIVNVYFTVDGVRLGHDSEFTTRAPSEAAPAGGESFTGVTLGHRGKGDTAAPLDVAVMTIAPEVGKIVVTWTDGTTAEPEPVAVADSPIRWIAVPRAEGKSAQSWQFYDRNGAKLPGDGPDFLR
ncbi:hypothetical protein [Kitasatospora aureofaciens]|uniref:hypothetical protein n=1 Tax=Kitasatospora aureofaciens TaxID=1894 RepID=UPI00381FBB06